jgi:hypothetical protein
VTRNLASTSDVLSAILNPSIKLVTELGLSAIIVDSVLLNGSSFVMQDEIGVCRGWIAGQTHVRGGHRAARRRDNDFSNFPKARDRQYVRCCLIAARHHHHGRTIWTEPVRYWRKACLLACLDHTVLLLIMATSLILHSIIVLADDPRWKTRPEANSTSNYMKKMLSLSICYKCLTLDNRYD